MKKLACVVFALAFIMVCTGSVSAQRKIKLNAQRISGDQVQITFEKNGLQYLVNRPGGIGDLQRHLNGACRGCNKVAGIVEATVKSFPDNPRKWRILLLIDLNIIEEKTDLGTFMRVTWMRAMQQFFPPDVQLELKDKAWYMKNPTVAKS